MRSTSPRGITAPSGWCRRRRSVCSSTFYSRPRTVTLYREHKWIDIAARCGTELRSKRQPQNHDLDERPPGLVHPEENPRPVDPAYNLNDDHVSLADGYPFLIIGQNSLDMLNEKLAAPVPMNRFRPNFVFTGGTPHVEDSWRNLLIGEIPFAGVKPCERCVLTTVNQETGEKGDEPLRTLSSYRNNGKSILFGQNLIALRNGIVRVGDSISIDNS